MRWIQEGANGAIDFSEIFWIDIWDVVSLWYFYVLLLLLHIVIILYHVLKLFIFDSLGLGCHHERDLVLTQNRMVSFVAIPFLISHHVCTIDNYLAVQEVTPFLI